jgi:hypothetical protein
MKHPPRAPTQGVHPERDDNMISYTLPPVFVQPPGVYSCPLYVTTIPFSISYIYAFCNNKQGMMHRDLYINTPHTNI